MATETYALSIQGSLNGEYRENVLHFKGDNLTADDTWDTGKDLVSSFKTTVESTWLGLMPPSYFLDRYAAERVQPKTSLGYHEQYQAFATPGTWATEAVSYNLCPVLFLIPPMGVKSGGKIFLPAVGNDAYVNNSPSAGYITAISALETLLLGNIGVTAITWQLAVFSRKLNITSVAQAMQLSPRIGFQGKRRKPVGS